MLNNVPEKMVDVGLLALTAKNFNKLPALLNIAKGQIKKRLYIRPECYSDLVNQIPNIYLEANKSCGQLDVRVLIDPRKTVKFDKYYGENESMEKELAVQNFLNLKKQFDAVVIGGTFDRIHNGHKVLISCAALQASKYLVTGVTKGEMNNKKILWELMEPFEARIRGVDDFLYDISVGIESRTEAITDAYGPSIVDQNLKLIVTSEDTRKGGEAVNIKRKERNMSTLETYVIPLIEGADEILNESKLSSSAQRRSLLGSILRQPEPKDLPKRPYIIGLTGGICSGKSSLATFLGTQNTEVIDCDKLGHALYSDSADLRNELIKEFGEAVATEGSINRKELGNIIFNSTEKRLRLNEIVWPKIAAMAKEVIAKTDKDIVILEAAALLEASFDVYCHQVWTVFIPQAEAIKRVVERDGFSEEAAQARVNSQSSVQDKIAKSNIVFCSLWSKTETQRQALKALDIVKSKYL
uniref:CTP_transf_like domain-containing protein n=1 Tax=Rhabditophanes sp. KR3021 TaxID=114890 RepID=A0AC35TPX4_9BILA